MYAIGGKVIFVTFFNKRNAPHICDARFVSLVLYAKEKISVIGHGPIRFTHHGLGLVYNRAQFLHSNIHLIPVGSALERKVIVAVFHCQQASLQCATLFVDTFQEYGEP